MNGRMAKKIHKEINAAVKTNAKEVMQSICEEKIITRIRYAIKIIFKYKIGEGLK